MFVYKLFDKRGAFPFFTVHMAYTDSNIPKSVFYSALVGEFLRIARISLLYKEFNEKSYGTEHNPSSVEKQYPKSFEDMKKRLPFW